MDVNGALQDIIGRYGLIAVHEALEREMRKTYEYLETLYGAGAGAEEKPVVEKTLDLEENGVKLGNNLHQIQENSVEIVGNLEEKSEDLVEETLRAEETLVDSKEKRAWPFINSEPTGEKTIEPARQFLKDQISKRKAEIQSSGLKRNDLLTKENLELLISQGLGYTEIGRRLGRMPATVKQYCTKYNLEILRNVRKLIPDSLQQYLENEEKKKEYLAEQKKTAKELVLNLDAEWIKNTKLCIYGIFRKKDLECVYIGSTEDFIKRVGMHKKGYEEGDERKLYTLMKENGGIENHMYIPLEKPENQIGLSVRESLWWESLKPLGNSVNPYFTT